MIAGDGRSMEYLGASVPVDVFTREEALAFLAERTGSADVEGAGLVAGELGSLPLALAQAAAVIAAQRLGYGTYLDRLHALPAGCAAAGGGGPVSARGGCGGAPVP